MPDLADDDSPGLRLELDLVTFGQRLRHLRRARRLTLAELGGKVDRAPSLLSLLENGRREPKLSLLHALAAALGVTVEELISTAPPSRRAELEIALEEAQRDPAYADLGLPRIRVSTRVPDEVLEHIVGLYAELRRRDAKPHANPEEARTINAALRRQMRERANYFPEIEAAATSVLESAGYAGGPLSEGLVLAIVDQCGYTLDYAADLPRSVRSVTDLRNRRIFLKRESLGMHSPRAILLQTLGHIVLGHREPRDFGDFLRQRVEANYFAAAVLMPEQVTVEFLTDAKQRHDISIEDLRDVFSVSYEMAAHRFTNLATRHLDLTCHFVRNDETGVIYKAYENSGLELPADASGATEGQRMCRYWAGRQVFAVSDRYSPHYQYTETPSGSHWCVAHVDPGRERHFAVTIGVPAEEARWFRGRDTAHRATSRCPTGECCVRPPSELVQRWEGMAWPSTRAHSHLLAVVPSGTFPGVDETDVYRFLERHSLE